MLFLLFFSLLINFRSRAKVRRVDNKTNFTDSHCAKAKNFQKSLVEFVKYEEDLKSRYQNKFTTEFQQIISSLEMICKILINNLDATREPFASVAKVMVMIQNQDIIRQNMENLVKCLKIVLEREDYLNNDSAEKSLDYVVFARQVLELSKVLFDNIESSLDESIFGLGELLVNMDLIISELEEDAGCLAKLFAGESAEGVVVGALATKPFSC